MLQRIRTDRFIGIVRSLILGISALLFFTAVAAGQPVQAVQSEAQLAAILCKNPAELVTNELLLEKNPQLVTVTLWNTLLKCDSSEQHRRSPAKAVAIHKLILRVAEGINKPQLIAESYYYLGRAYSELDDCENSIHAYEQSKQLFEQAGIEGSLSLVLADLGSSYLAAEDYEKARLYSEEGLKIARQAEPAPVRESLGPIQSGRARSLCTLSEIDLHHGNHAEALNKLRDALALYEQLNRMEASYTIQAAEVLIAQARVYGEMGEYGRAFNELTKAHQVSRDSGDQKTSANIMRNQAALFLEQEDYAAARKYLSASLAIYKRLGKARDETSVLLNLGLIEQLLGRQEEALRLFQLTMRRAQARKLLDVQIAAGEGIGVVLTAKRDFPNALNALNQSLEIARRVNAKTREVELLWRTAQAYYAMQDYRESAAIAEEALTLARSRRLPKLTYLITTTLGEAYAADGKVELAVTTLKDAVNQIEIMRDEVVGLTEGRHLFFENKVGPYRTLVKLLTAQGKNFEALLYAERAKSRVLLETVRSNRSDLQDRFTEREKAEAEVLINKLHAVTQQIQSQPGSKPANELQNELNAARRELVLFSEQLAAAHPELPLRAGPPQPLTQASLNSLVLDGDLAYLEYVITGDKVGLFILKRNSVTTEPGLTYVKLPVNAAELRQKVNEFHTALAERHPDYGSLGRDLYLSLMAPVAVELQNIRTICIIPDEFLWSLPFQALITTRGNYFIQEYSLYYAPSFSVLNEMALRGRQPSSKESLLAFGNPIIEPNDELKQQLHSLPEAETEVVGVGTAAFTRTKKILVGRQADEKTFKALAPQYATIHLATHGVLDNRDPLNSFLLLTRTDGDKENDGLLRAREIIDLHLDADLAVLSACETANGRISPGEGVIGMSWAFFVAGARSLVVSQWRVNSGSTSQLMKSFYQALARQKGLKGVEKSQALRVASLDLLKDPRYRHPFYWAGFVLVSSN